MSSITFDLGNVPSVLAALRDQGNTQWIANAAAERYVDDTLDWIAAGRGFTPRHGGAGLEGAINWNPSGNGTATVSANKDYAGFVEHGTGPRAYGPRNDRQALRFPVGGGAGFGFARVMIRLGNRPHPFFFVDSETREEHVHAAGLSVLARIIANGQ